MRLGDVLSKPINLDYVQVEGFLINKKGIIGQQSSLNVGKVMLNYYCSNCKDNRTFTSKGRLCCVFVNKQIISIDCVMTCNCGTNAQLWFLVECEEDICSHDPRIRILKKSEKLSTCARINDEKYGEFSFFLDKADSAYREGFGSGAIVYLRKCFEKITVQTATALMIEYTKHDNGNAKNFRILLEQVDKQASIIPKEFSEDGYKLFRELSEIVHGDYDEEIGLKKFLPLRTLVIGILDNVIGNSRLRNAKKSLGWEDSDRRENCD